MISLFDKAGVTSNNNRLKFTNERLTKLVKSLRQEEPKDIKFKQAYKLHHKSLKSTAKDIRLLQDEDIKQIMMAGAYALKRDMPKFLSTKHLDTADLDKFLNFNIESLYIKSTKSFRKLRTGMKFVDSFTREYYTDVKQGIKADEDSLINMYEVCCISLYLATPKTRMTTTRFFSTYTHASKNPLQFASNFNMLISAYLFNHYGLKSMKARGSKEVHLHSSSEGWLARMVSSLYVAIRNPNIKVKYVSIDPNIKVIEAFNKCKKYLQEYTKVKNWEAEIFNYGSEEPKMELLKTKGYNIDCSFTSPPYLDLEAYPDTAILRLSNGCTGIKISFLDELQIKGKGLTSVAELQVGDIIDENYYQQKHKGKLVSPTKGLSIKRIDKTPQCATLYNTARKWNEKFLRPTVDNIYKSSYQGGYLILNVVDFKKHPTMEDDTVSISEEQGYKLLTTLKYPLIRKPGKGKDGIRLADSKKNYEPIFVFKK